MSPAQDALEQLDQNPVFVFIHTDIESYIIVRLQYPWQRSLGVVSLPKYTYTSAPI